MDQLGPMTIGFIVVAIILVALALAIRGREGGRTRIDIPPPENASDADVQRIYAAGHKIQAIKLYRELHNVGLKEAKEAVERMDKTA